MYEKKTSSNAPPQDSMKIVFAFLSAGSILSLLTLSKYYYSALRGNDIWKPKFKKYFPLLLNEAKQEKAKQEHWWYTHFWKTYKKESNDLPDINKRLLALSVKSDCKGFKEVLTQENVNIKKIKNIECRMCTRAPHKSFLAWARHNGDQKLLDVFYKHIMGNKELKLDHGIFWAIMCHQPGLSDQIQNMLEKNKDMQSTRYYDIYDDNNLHKEIKYDLTNCNWKNTKRTIPMVFLDCQEILWIAAQANNLDVVKLLPRMVDLPPGEINPCSKLTFLAHIALREAAKFGHTKIIKYLFNQKIDSTPISVLIPNSEKFDPDGGSTHIKDRDVQGVRYGLYRPSRLTAMHALEFAVLYRHFDCAIMIINANSDVRQQLPTLIKFGWKKIVDHLIKEGMDLRNCTTDKDEIGAIQISMLESQNRKLVCDVVDRLFPDSLADKQTFLKKLLFMAAKLGHLELVYKLIERYGVNPYEKVNLQVHELKLLSNSKVAYGIDIDGKENLQDDETAATYLEAKSRHSSQYRDITWEKVENDIKALQAKYLPAQQEELASDSKAQSPKPKFR